MKSKNASNYRKYQQNIFEERFEKSISLAPPSKLKIPKLIF